MDTKKKKRKKKTFFQLKNIKKRTLWKYIVHPIKIKGWKMWIVGIIFCQKLKRKSNIRNHDQL